MTKKQDSKPSLQYLQINHNFKMRISSEPLYRKAFN